MQECKLARGYQMVESDIFEGGRLADGHIGGYAWRVILDKEVVGGELFKTAIIEA